MDSLIEIARRPFLDLAPELAGALVLLDAGAAEVAQLSLGPAFLLGLGASNVCDLERCHPDDALLGALTAATVPGAQPPPLRLVVFVTRLLTDAHPLIMRALMVHHSAARANICCSVSELAHAQQAGTDLGVEAYSEYIEALRQDLAQARADAGLPAPREDALRLSVRHLPLHLAALDSNTFVLPAAGAAAGMAAAGGRAAGFGPADAPSDDAEDGAMGVSGGLSLLAHALVDVARQMGARVEPFAIGPVSTQLAREVSTLPQPLAGGLFSQDHHHARGAAAAASPRAGAAHGGLGGGLGGEGPAMPMALILLDRSLDMAACCGHQEHFLDAAAALLLRRPPAAAPPRAGAGRWAMHRPADMRLEAPGLAPWDCLGPQSAGDLAPPPAPNPDTAAASSTAGGGGPPAPAAVEEEKKEEEKEDAAAGALQEPLPALVGAPLLGAPLFEPSDRRAVQLLEALAARRSGRDALQLLRKALKDALRQERVQPGVRAKLSSVVGAGELEALAASLVQAPGDAALRQLPAVFGGMAAAQVLGSPRWDAWGAAAAMERQIVAILDDAAVAGTDGAGPSIRELFTDALQAVAAGRGVLSASDMVQLLVFLYSLSGDLTPPAPPLYSADEHAIRRALADAIAAEARRASGGGGGGGGWPEAWEGLPGPVQALLHSHLQQQQQEQQEQQEPDISDDLAQQLDARLAESFGRLRWAAATRGKLRDVRRLMSIGPEGAPEAAPLVRLVLGKLLLQADNRDLQQPGTQSLGGLLKAGLGRFGLGGALGALGAAHEFPAVMIFVVGGLSAAEWRGAKHELEAHTHGRRPAVMLGGTSLLAPADAARHLLG